MGKAKALKHNANKGKQQLHEIKGGSIKKNKDSKLKNTSKGQKHTPNKNKVPKKYQKPSPNSNAAKQSKQDSPNKKRNLKQSTNSSKAQKIGKKTFNSRKTEKQLDKSNSNITESDDSSFKSDETFETDSDVPDIFDKSLAESDDDDEDYEKGEEEEDMDDDDDSDEEETTVDDNSDEEEMSERKGVKMFKGLQSKTKKNKKVQKRDDDTDDDEVESDESTTENTTENTTDEYDTDEDEEIRRDKGEKKKDNIKKSKFKIVKQYVEIDPKVKENSNLDYNTSDDTNDDSDDEDAELGTKALLGKSIADDDDDEDFNAEDEDSNSDEDDITSEEESESDNAIRKANEEFNNCIIGKYNITKTERDNLARRIILIDNIPKPTPSYEIAEMCAEFGKYEIFEARPYPAFFTDLKMQPLEPLDWLNRDYPDLETFSVNVLYKSRQDALKAMKHMHGMMFARNYLNVITADLTEQEPDHAVYVTNIRKTMPDNDLWEMFKQCGSIVRIRNVRDPISGLNKGFGYVSFNNEAAVKYALTLDGVKLNGRRIKVLPYPYRRNLSLNNLTEEIKRRNQGIKRILSLGDILSSKKFKKNSGEPAARNVEPERNIKKHKKQEEDKKKSTAFQGQMVDLKNKRKKNKLDKKKKKMAEKLTAKSIKKN
ncbi:nucleolar protein 12 [Mycetomoellerius zeteki]|uniref:nucleolar protein 12 n=1 Tax=Mycetomoellerius zeteki TaxID=64791 RepID=UPI00084ECA39|nr:PREDICTED: nucleolar protein 12-like [Trachymyrmex zeteki]